MKTAIDLAIEEVRVKIKHHTKIIKLNDSKIIMQLSLTENELSVLKLSLKHYDNSFGLGLLKRIEKEIDNR